jgi:hypothetical protein
MSRLWQTGEALQLRLDEAGTPVGLRWAGHWHSVARLSNRWRVDVGWWRWRVWRDYYKLVTQDGVLIEIYQDLLTGQWYVQRLYD